MSNPNDDPDGYLPPDGYLSWVEVGLIAKGVAGPPRSQLTHKPKSYSRYDLCADDPCGYSPVPKARPTAG